MTISAFLPVFNEEKRISDTLESLMWCDEIVLIDKNSTDRTVAIASNYGDKVKICFMNNSKAYDSSEWMLFLDNCSSEWAILFTASDVIHPKLAMKIREKINNVKFNFDIMHIPYRRFVLGLDSKRSPWHTELHSVVFRKSSMVYNKGGVHNAIKIEGREYKFKYDSVECMYHLTHETVDIMMDRHIRYWRGEANEKGVSLNYSIKKVFKSVFHLFFFKKLPFLGRDGFMLLFSFLTYHMMSYVYKWEKERGSATQVYSDIKKNIKLEWESYGR